MQEVRVVSYDPDWPRAFATLRDTVMPTLKDIALRIEHVGSTSVPGLDAKPIIDMTVVVREPEDVAVAIQALERLDYEHRGNLGIIGREAFYAPPGAIPHHLYVCVEGSTPLINHTHVRDHLRAHDADRAAYARLKHDLARAHAGDIDRYTRAKTDLLMRILATAPLTPAQRAVIRAQNA